MRYEILLLTPKREKGKEKRCDPISPPLAYVAGLIDLGSQPQPVSVQSSRQVETKQSNCQDRKRQRQRQKKESRSSTKSSTISPAQTRLAASVSDRYFSSILFLVQVPVLVRSAQAALAPLMCLASRRDSFQRTHWLQGWHSVQY